MQYGFVLPGGTATEQLRRVLRCDGVLPVCMDACGFRATTPDDLRAMQRWFDAHGVCGRASMS
jgi:hypothetical protein